MALHLIDSSSYLHRAYWALPAMTNPAGEPVNAVYGFAKSMIGYIRARVTEGDYIAAVFDAPRGKTNARSILDPNYKAHRKPLPPEMVAQFAPLREFASALGLHPVEARNTEADDLVASYAEAAKADGLDVMIASSDKDFFSLIGAGIGMWDPLKQRELDAAYVAGKFGVEPGQMCDFLALAGDNADGVVGVPGIGKVIAAKLIREHGSLNGAIAAAHERGVSPERIGQLIVDNETAARRSYELVTLKTDVDLPLPIPELLFAGPDEAALDALLAKHDFRSIREELERAA